jgi:hypothetical protein
MSYVRAVAGYLAVALVAVPLVTHLWAQYQLRKILAEGSGVTLRQYVAPRWHRLAERVRSGEVTLAKEDQAARLDRIAKFFESEARSEQEKAAIEIQSAQFFFRASLAVLLIQLAVGVAFGISDARKQRRAAGAPPN